MKIALFVWNPFQFYQFESIVDHLPDATYVLEKRRVVDRERLFTNDFIASVNAPVLELERSEIPSLDGQFDAILCQTAFGHMEQLNRTKIVGMQYSMSKERHQYGPWRTLCDLNLVYGQYSYDRVSPYSPSVMVGNPRFDRWFAGRFDEIRVSKVRARLDPRKKTVLYLPTWGALSSMSAFGEAVANLGRDYNVIAKVHHKTDSHEATRKAALSSAGIQDIFGATDDLLYLLRESDVVLSDYSGAIFDAINVSKPVILLQHRPEELASIGAEKFGLESIEYLRRAEIGPVVSSPDQLAPTVARLLDGELDFSQSNRRLKQECFAREIDCGAHAAGAVEAFVNEPIARPYYQIYFRDTLREARAKEESRKLRSKQRSPARVVKQAIRSVARAPSKPGFRRRVLHAALRLPRLALGPLRSLIEKQLVTAIAADTENGDAFRPSAWLQRAVPLLSVRRLDALAVRYDRPESGEIAVWLRQVCARRSEAVGLTSYITILAKYDRNEELTRLMDGLIAKPAPELIRYLQRAARVQDHIGTRYAQMAEARAKSREYVLAQLAGSANRRQNAHLLNILVVNRWLDDAESLLGQVPLSSFSLGRTHEAIQRSKRLMKEHYALCEMANHNYQAQLPPDDHLCICDGQAQRVRNVAPDRVVEFFLPPYFFSASETERATRERICAMLRTTLSALGQQGFAVVPRHQFRLDRAQPAGHWPVSMSYHTTGGKPGHWHIKDSPLAGYFSFDPDGYSGWASIARLRALPAAAMHADSGTVESTWTELLERYVAAGVSKYQQGTDAFVPPAEPYVFLPMQTVGDTVARLAWIPTIDLARALVRLVPAHGYTLVIKRHPKCTSVEVDELIQEHAETPRVVFTTASIHSILPGAAAVVTVNSGVGMEALLHGRSVITTGACEYALVTRQARDEKELARQLDTIGTPADIEKIKRFLHHYVTAYAVRADDGESVARKVRDIMQSVPVPQARLAVNS